MRNEDIYISIGFSVIMDGIGKFLKSWMITTVQMLREFQRIATSTEHYNERRERKREKNYNVDHRIERKMSG